MCPSQSKRRCWQNNDSGKPGYRPSGPWEKGIVVDADAQVNLTDSLGFHEPDNLPVSLATILTKTIMEEPYEPDEGILHHAEGSI